jgi:hypothetical protein
VFHGLEYRLAKQKDLVHLGDDLIISDFRWLSCLDVFPLNRLNSVYQHQSTVLSLISEREQAPSVAPRVRMTELSWLNSVAAREMCPTVSESRVGG